MKDLMGIILVHRWPNEVVAALSAKWPVASLIHRYPGHPVDVVGTDDEANLQALVDHLRKQGHSRIGFFGYDQAFSWARARYAAYVEALLAQGLPFDPASTIQVASEILADPSPPDCSPYLAKLKERMDAGVKAWITSSFVVAQGLCVVLAKAGCKIPRDVAITGYHGGGRGPEIPGLPRPTSIEVDSELIGSTATHLLNYRSQQSIPPASSLLLPARLVQGETTLPA
jgi:DNA-binding LacI/PurR family transcriptional regulator